MKTYRSLMKNLDPSGEKFRMVTPMGDETSAVHEGEDMAMEKATQWDSTKGVVLKVQVRKWFIIPYYKTVFESIIR